MSIEIKEIKRRIREVIDDCLIEYGNEKWFKDLIFVSANIGKHYHLEKDFEKRLNQFILRILLDVDCAEALKDQEEKVQAK
jgi:hypothetical protein